MNIEQIVLRHLALSLKEPFHTSYGAIHTREIILVECHGAGGTVGYGESAPITPPWYTEESLQSAWHVLETYLCPLTLAGDFETPAELAERLDPVRRNYAAKTGLESAVWDLWAKALGLPLAQLIGGDKTAIDVGVVIGIPSHSGTRVQRVDALLQRVEEALTGGYRRIKLKIRPGWDLEPLKAVRSSFPDAPLAVDANASYAPEHIDTLLALDGYGLEFIEQPFDADDLTGHARVQAHMQTAICLDESIVTPACAELAVGLGSCRIINVKPGRVGGISAAKRIHDACQSRGVPVWCGGLLESGVGRLHSLIIASLPNFSLPADLSPPLHYLSSDILASELAFASPGRLDIPQAPGIGIDVDPARLDAHTVRIVRLFG